MKLDFLKKKIDTSFVKKDFYRNPKKDWFLIVVIFFVMLVCIFVFSIYLFYLVNNENLVSAGVGSSSVQSRLDNLKLEKISKVISDRKTNKELLINSKPKTLDPSL